jgi:two-component system response regulator AtoC
MLPEEILFGRSVVMSEVRKRAEKICRTDIPVLIFGEGGTGKEALARWIHAHSPYHTGQFVKVNCAAIPGSLLESELFGYEKGAFTGAHISKPGRVELADQGTLFLDEITDLNLCLQAKLLQFLQDGRFCRIGDEQERSVSTRVICSTSHDLQQEIAANNFRADLFYRINVVWIHLPGLRDRREDIPVMAEYFRGQLQEKFQKESDTFPLELLEHIKKQNWRGNIRELSNAIARYVLLGAEAITHDPTAKRSGDASEIANVARAVPLRWITKEAVREPEKKAILEALRANQWNRRKAAQTLKISYRTLLYKLREAGLPSAHNRGEFSFSNDRAATAGSSSD